MSMNRRAMLTYSVASLALVLTGCKTNTTTVVVQNNTGAKLSLDASSRVDGKTYKFVHKNIPNGKSAKQKYVTKQKKGSTVNFTVNSVTIGGTTTSPKGVNLPIIVGQTNTFVVDKNGNVTKK